jgi:RNA polymerase sigma-70 factor (ECF subfamily)
LAELYASHVAGARRHLQHFGGAPQDMDDLVQEVFLVLHGKRELLPTIAPFDPWLREVCRRVAAGDRRRAYRRREIVSGEHPDSADDALPSDSALEQGERAERLHLALAQLDERARDLVALHELGDLPLEDVAELIDADRKTVRKRLGAALKRLTVLLGSARPAFAAELRAPSSQPLVGATEAQLLVLHPGVTVGLVGSTLISVWPGLATLEALEQLDNAMTRAAELCHGSCAYLAVVGTECRPPNLEARQKIVTLLEKHARNVRVYATAIEGGGAWIVRPIMTGLSFLARPPFPMQYFEGVPLAASWLAEKHPQLSNASAATLVETTEWLRSRTYT